MKGQRARAGALVALIGIAVFVAAEQVATQGAPTAGEMVGLGGRDPAP